MLLLLLLLLKNSQWDVCTERSCSAKESVWRFFPSLCCPETYCGMNRISHPDWVKLCVELDYAPNQNTKIPSATVSLLIRRELFYIVFIIWHKEIFNYKAFPQLQVSELCSPFSDNCYSEFWCSDKTNTRVKTFMLSIPKSLDPLPLYHELLPLNHLVVWG